MLVGVVYHSDLKALRACLDTLHYSWSEVRVIVVDASVNSDAAGLAAEYSVGWVDGSRNAGYAWALHRAIECSDWEHDVFVAANSDIQFTDGALYSLVSNALNLGGPCYGLQKRSDGGVAPYSVVPELSIRNSVTQWLGVGRRRRDGRSSRFILGVDRLKKPTQIPRELCGSGAVVAIPDWVWRLTGGFDRDYFLFEEDRSFSSAVGQRQIPSFLCGDAVVLHDGGFRSRGRGVASFIEPAVSEQIAWKKHAVGPGWLVFSIQSLGVTLRLFASCVLASDQAGIYWRVLRLLVRAKGMKEAGFSGADGQRRSAESSILLDRGDG